MCPHGYHHNGFMETPALGTQEVRIYIYISKGLQCALTAITIVALWQLPHLGHGMCVYTLFGLHCEVIALFLYIYIYIIQFICILESQVVECSMGSFYT